MKRLPVIYLASFYRTGSGCNSSDNKSVGFIGKIKNIMRARTMARKLWHMGYTVICPVSNNGLFDFGKNVPEEYIIEGMCELVRRCDVVYIMEKEWERSAGICMEIQTAVRYHIPVFFDMLSLTLWREEWYYHELTIGSNLKQLSMNHSDSTKPGGLETSRETGTAKATSQTLKPTPNSLPSVNSWKKKRKPSASGKQTSVRRKLRRGEKGV